MFSLEDYVVNRQTHQIGRVIGYGHKIVNDAYEPTLKVLVDQAESPDRKELVVEDLSSAWSRCQNPEATVGAAGQ